MFTQFRLQKVYNTKMASKCVTKCHILQDSSERSSGIGVGELYWICLERVALGYRIRD